MSLEYLKSECIKLGTKRPELKEDIQGIYELAVSEIESGESYENEIELALNSLKEMVAA